MTRKSVLRALKHRRISVMLELVIRQLVELDGFFYRKDNSIVTCKPSKTALFEIIFTVARSLRHPFDGASLKITVIDALGSLPNRFFTEQVLAESIQIYVPHLNIEDDLECSFFRHADDIVIVYGLDLMEKQYSQRFWETFSKLKGSAKPLLICIDASHCSPRYDKFDRDSFIIRVSSVT